MGTFADLYAFLDGLDAEQLSQSFSVAPDAALRAADQAIRTGSGIDAALANIEAQIKAVRPVFRGAFFGEVKSATTGREPALPFFQRMMCDLHLAAAQLLQRQSRWDDAHGQFVRAAACGGLDSRPRMFLVDLYGAMGRDFDALDALRRDALGEPLGAFTLLRFALDTQAAGKIAVASAAYAHAEGADPSGVIGSVIAARKALYPAAEAPDQEDLRAARDQGFAALGRGDVRAALHQFEAIAGVAPGLAGIWHIIGRIYQLGEDALVNAGIVHSIAEVITASWLEEARARDLERAAYAYALAGAIDPQLDEASLGQAICLALLERHQDALAAVERAVARLPESAAYHAILGVMAELAGDGAAAARALATASRLDRDDPIVHFVQQALQARRPRDAKASGA
jgi:tetratricopeptide (TPR) repeat protein